MRYRAKLTSKGQLTLPAGLRAHLGVGPGQAVTFEVSEDGRVSVEKLSPSFRDLRGMIKLDRPVSGDEIDAWVREARDGIGGSRS